jgi:hypothetical protein
MPACFGHEVGNRQSFVAVVGQGGVCRRIAALQTGPSFFSVHTESPTDNFLDVTISEYRSPQELSEAIGLGQAREGVYEFAP